MKMLLELKLYHLVSRKFKKLEKESQLQFQILLIYCALYALCELHCCGVHIRVFLGIIIH